MGVYLFKRTIVMAITFLGIIVLTFGISRLTPGDPAMLAMSPGGARGGGSEALSDETLRETRRVMGLDRPLLLNFQFENRDWHARDLIDRYLRSSGFWRDSARFELGEINTIAVLHAIERLGTLHDENATAREVEGAIRNDAKAQRDDLLEILPILARTQPLGAPFATPDEAVAAWRRWADENRERLSDESVRRDVAAYLESGLPETFDRVRDAGGAAMARLMPVVLKGRDPVAQQRAVRAAQVCANKPASWAASASAAPSQSENEVATRRWASWWNRVELRFARPSAPRRAVHIVTNTQFGLWMRQFLTFDFGVSTRDNRPVIDILKERIPVTLQIGGLAVLLTYILAIPLGVFSATHQNSFADRALTLLLFLLYSVPVFWLAQMMILTLTGGHGWPDIFPSRGLSSEGAILGAEGWLFWRWLGDRLWHLVLPVAAQTVVALAFLSRQMRVAMLETIRQDFIQTARAKGLRESTVIYKHALRNSLIPIVTLAADLLPALIGGSVVIEYIFSLNGMGKLTFEAILNRDYPVINCVFAFSAMLTLLGILLADIGYAMIDPRIRYNK